MLKGICMKKQQELRENLTDELAVVSWKGLLPEMLNDRLYFVSSELDLVEVGIKVALDRTDEIKKLLETGALARPGSEQIADWESKGSLFQCIIVEPFVFFQEYIIPES